MNRPSPAEIAADVVSGRRSAGDVAAAALARIEDRNPSLGAFLTVTRRQAEAQAAAVDARVARGEDTGPLAGAPVALKDNLCTRGIPTTAGSRMLEEHVPLYDATVVGRLREAGAVMVGKTNLDEFGMGSSNENSAFGPVRNPADPNRVAGGSSGGSAAAVAAGLAGLALGSDTGGSVRQPAAFCGVYGLKPTYGRVSRFGLIAFASSLDQVGALADDVDSLALLYDVIAGPDERDSTCSDRPAERVSGGGGGVEGLRVGVASGLLVREGVQSEVADAVVDAAGILKAAGASVSDVTLPDPEVAISAYYLLATAEASSNLARYDGVRYGLRIPGRDLEDMYRRTRSGGFGPEVKRRIMLGTYVLSAGYYDAYYLRAQKVRAVLRAAFEDLFRNVDLILLPTTPTTAFRLGEMRDDPLAMYLADVFTVTANLTGIPALNVPMGADGRGLPLGVQLLAGSWREDLLFRGASVLHGTGRDRSSETQPGDGAAP